MEKKPSYDLHEEELAYISEYLNDELGADERSVFDERLRDDPVFERKVEEVRALLVGIKEANIAEQLNLFHAELQPEEAVISTSSKPLWQRIRWLAAAAVLVLTMVGLWFFRSAQPQEQKLFSRYYKADPGLPTLMGTSDNYEFEEAMVDYKTGDFRKAIGKWYPLLVENRSNDTLNYFIGVAYLANSQPDSAVVFLDKVTAAPTSVFQSDAYWYKALAMLKQGRKADALMQLRRTEHHAKDSLLNDITSIP